MEVTWCEFCLFAFRLSDFQQLTRPHPTSGQALPATSSRGSQQGNTFCPCRLVERSVLCNAPHDLLGALHRLVQMFDGSSRANCRCRRLRRRPWRGGRYARSDALGLQFDLYRSRASNARRSSPPAVTRIPNREKVPPCVPHTGASSLRALVRWGRRSVTFNKCSFKSSKLLPPPPRVEKNIVYITHALWGCVTLNRKRALLPASQVLVNKCEGVTELSPRLRHVVVAPTCRRQPPDN